MEHLPSLLASVEPYLRYLPFNALDIETEDRGFGLTVESTEPQDEGLWSSLRLWLPKEAESSTHFWGGFLNSIPGLSNLREIGVGPLHQVTFDFHLTHLLSKCIHLDKLCLRGPPVAIVLGNLTNLITKPGDDTATIPIMPVLRELQLSQCSWRTPEELNRLLFSGNYNDCAATEAFAKRRELGYPIYYVEIDCDCVNIFAQDMQCIRDNVTKADLYCDTDEE